MRPIRITHVSTYDARGGAGIAASRLHFALRETGAKSFHLVRFKSSNDPHTYIADAAGMEDGSEAILSRAIQSEYIDKRRTPISNTLFSLGYPGVDITQHPVMARSDVVNLHWVSSFQSIDSVGSILSSGMPVIWTLHDQNAFTGGCHYSAGCLGYMRDCNNCPQLTEDHYGLTVAMLKDRIAMLATSQRFLIVTPSEWMHQCASCSQVLRNAEIVTIPNSVPIEKFTPGSRTEARQNLGIDPISPLLLFGAENHREKRKGFSDLMNALKALLADPVTAKIIRQATILCFGEPTEELKVTGLRVVSLGKIDNERKLRQAYVASDLFVLPSREDNLPNTVLESLACGTPVLAFDVGGISEAVRHGKTGWLVPKGDCVALGRALVNLLNAPECLQSWASFARKDAVEKFSPTIQSRRYLECYIDLLQRLPEQPYEKKRSTYNNRKIYINTKRSNSFDLIFDSISCKAVLPAYVTLVNEYEKLEMDKALRGKQIESLTGMVKESETDRNARGEQIETLTRLFKESEADRNARGEQIETLTRLFKESEADRNARGEQIETLTRLFKESEADRNARGEQIETLTRLIKDIEQDRAALRENIRSLFSNSTFRLANRFFGWPEANSKIVSALLPNADE